jgi:hypothetical protein
MFIIHHVHISTVTSSWTNCHFQWLWICGESKNRIASDTSRHTFKHVHRPTNHRARFLNQFQPRQELFPHLDQRCAPAAKWAMQMYISDMYPFSYMYVCIYIYTASFFLSVVYWYICRISSLYLGVFGTCIGINGIYTHIYIYTHGLYMR